MVPSGPWPCRVRHHPHDVPHGLFRECHVRGGRRAGRCATRAHRHHKPPGQSHRHQKPPGQSSWPGYKGCVGGSCVDSHSTRVRRRTPRGPSSAGHRSPDFRIHSRGGFFSAPQLQRRPRPPDRTAASPRVQTPSSNNTTGKKQWHAALVVRCLSCNRSTSALCRTHRA